MLFVIGMIVGFALGVVITCILLGKRAMKMKDTIEDGAENAINSFKARYDAQMAAYDAKVAAEEAAEEERSKAAKQKDKK